MGFDKHMGNVVARIFSRAAPGAMISGARARPIAACRGSLQTRQRADNEKRQSQDLRSPTLVVEQPVPSGP